MTTSSRTRSEQRRNDFFLALLDFDTVAVETQPSRRAPRPALILGVVAAVIALAWCVRFWTPAVSDPALAAKSPPGPTRDDHETSIFWKRGAWQPTGLRPYLDVFSEYPPLATWAFGIPYLFVDTGTAPPKELLKTLDATAPSHPSMRRFGDYWSFFMAAAWLGIAALTFQLSRERGICSYWTWICLGPAALYLALQRFDALPALALTGALLALTRGFPISGFVLLGCGIMVKIYPVVAVPAAFAYVWRSQGPKRACFALTALVLTCVLCELPVFVDGCMDPAWSAPWRPGLEHAANASPVEGGLAAVKAPFVYQGGRDTNPASLAERLFQGWLGVSYDRLLAGIKVFRVIQFAPALVAMGLLYWRPHPQRLLSATAALVATFVLFHNIYSPQFHLWLVPLVAVAGAGMPGAAAALLLVFIDVVTYAQFPILSTQAVFDPATQRNVYPSGFYTVVDMRLILTAGLTGVLWYMAAAPLDPTAGTADRAAIGT